MDAETQTAQAAPASPYPLMFSQIQMGGRRLRNRLVHAAMSTRYAANREVTPKLIDYHANRARGGAAMIVTEPLGMTPWQTDHRRVAVYGQDNLDGLKRWAEAVESENSCLLAQVQDSGRGRHKDGRSAVAFGPSARPDDWSWTVPHVLSLDDIKRLVDYFVSSAGTLHRCGFAGVEISAGHGHLFHQFMSPWSNGRDDAYGGDLANRLRLVQDVIEGIRAACGSDFIVGLKLPGDDGVPDSIGPEQAAEITRWFAARRQVDYFAFAMGSHHRSLEMHVPDTHTPRGTYFSLIKSLRPAADGIPVCALGRRRAKPCWPTAAPS
jgi:hypothetical protein